MAERPRRSAVAWVNPALAGALALVVASALPLLGSRIPQAGMVNLGSGSSAYLIPLQGSLGGGHQYSQRLPVRDGLSEVDLYLYGFTGGDLDSLVAAPVRLRLFDSDRELASTTQALDDVGVAQSHLVRLAFAPIADSGSRRLVLVVDSPGAAAGTGPTLLVSPLKGQLRLRDRGADTAYTLPVGVRYGSAVPLSSLLGTALDRASQLHPDPFKGATIAVVAVLTALTILALVFVAARLAIDEDEPEPMVGAAGFEPTTPSPPD